jgi:pimeloyl-ACP methyl ester carboxylesterase
MASCRFLWVALCLLFASGCQPLIQPPSAVVPAEGRATALSSATLGDGVQIEIGDRTLFLTCLGEGSPTVLLEAGLGADHAAWAMVQPAIAEVTRVCSYDRAGTGQSEPASTPRTGQAIVEDLHTLLASAEITNSLILVGHSFGALHVRLYAAEYPAEVAGLVLVDPVHEAWWSRAEALLPTATDADSAQLIELRRYFASEGGNPEENVEGIDIAATATQVRSSGDLGNLPVIILTAGIPDLLPSGLPDALQAPLAKLLQEELPAELAKLSPNSMRLTVPDSGHNIPQRRPDVILAAIKTLVQVSRDS